MNSLMTRCRFSRRARDEDARQRLHSRSIIRVLVAILWFASLSTADDCRGDKKGETDADAGVAAAADDEVDAKIKAAVDALVADLAKGPPDDGQKLWIRWYVFREKTQERVDALFKNQATRANVEYFWSQFGKHGGVTDYSLVVAAPGMMHPGMQSIFNSSTWQEDHADDVKSRFPSHYRVVILGSEIQTRSFLADRTKLKRYHRLILWSRLVYRRADQDQDFVPGMARQTATVFAGNEIDDKYWWGARNFVLLAYATGREDLLDNVKPEDLRPRFKTWHEWVQTRSPWLVANPETLQWKVGRLIPRRQDGSWGMPPMPLPERPCDDWDEQVPMPNPAEVVQLEQGEIN
ncbi:MAG: hypothetical protein WD069_01920 [Planctomycetales bacterium]